MDKLENSPALPDLSSLCSIQLSDMSHGGLLTTLHTASSNNLSHMCSCDFLILHHILNKRAQMNVSVTYSTPLVDISYPGTLFFADDEDMY